MSGNGYLLLYPIDLPNDAASTALVTAVLNHLAGRFNGERAVIDTTMYNASRIIALVGTLKVKGDPLPDRPHRRSGLVYEPEMLTPVSAGRLAAIVDVPSAAKTVVTITDGELRAGWVEDRLKRAGAAYREKPPDAAGIVWFGLEHCPYHDDGTPWECAVGEAPDRRATGHCFHNRGAGKGWADFRDALGLGPSAPIGQSSRPDPEAGPAPPDASALIVNIAAYRAAVPSVIPWVCRPIAYIGGVTLISGPPKAGKSTLAADLMRCRETGARFLGAWDVTTGPTLLVTEEGGVAVIHKTEGLAELDILDRRTAVTAGLAFAQVLETIAAWGQAHPGGLVFIDTLAIWAGILDENDAGQATRAIATITVLAQTEALAIVLIHHARKSGGDDGEAIRGSGAILATVDIGIELSRVKPGSDERHLDVMGRVILPERFRLTFDRSTMAYGLTDQSEGRLAEIERDLVGIPSEGPGLSRADIGRLWQKDPRDRIVQLTNAGRMRAIFGPTGPRARGWHYWSIPAVWTPEDRDDD
jgi:hypothetical protein